MVAWRCRRWCVEGDAVVPKKFLNRRQRRGPDAGIQAALLRLLLIDPESRQRGSNASVSTACQMGDLPISRKMDMHSGRQPANRRKHSKHGPPILFPCIITRDKDLDRLDRDTLLNVIASRCATIQHAANPASPNPPRAAPSSLYGSAARNATPTPTSAGSSANPGQSSGTCTSRMNAENRQSLVNLK